MIATRLLRPIRMAFAIAAGAGACRGLEPSALQVRVTPAVADVAVGSSIRLAASVEGSYSREIAWSLVEGPGTIDDAGIYEAPGYLPYGAANRIVVRATSRVSAEASGEAILRIVRAPVSPRTGPTEGGTHLRVEGTSFTMQPGDVVLVAGTAATTTYLSPLALDVVTPPHPPGPVDLAVTRAGVTVARYPAAFHYGVTAFGYSGGTATRACGFPQTMVVAGGEPVELLATCGDHAVEILFDGHGLSRGTRELFPPFGATRSAAADLDQDGDRDVVTWGNFDGEGFGVLLHGSGGLVVLASFPGSAIDVALGDLTGDGLPDLVALEPGATISVRAGDGAGGFSAPIPHPCPASATRITTGDLDGTPGDELAIAYSATGGGVVVYSAGAPVLSANGLGATSKDLRIAPVGPSTTPRLLDLRSSRLWLLAAGAGVTGSVQLPGVIIFPGVAVRAGHADGDEVSEAVVQTLLQLWKLPVDAAGVPGTFAPVLPGGQVNPGTQALGFELIDVDMDGHDDLATNRLNQLYGAVEVFYAHEEPVYSFGPGRLDVAFTPSAVAVVDEGATAVVAVAVATMDPTVALFESGTGSAVIRTFSLAGADPVIALRSADLAKDGTPDLLAVISGDSVGSGSLWTLEWNGSTFDEPVRIGAAGAPVHDAIPADLDGDGAIDVVAAAEDGVRVFWGPLAEAGPDADLVVSLTDAAGVRVADADLDADPDLIALDAGSRLTVIRGNGTRVFDAPPIAVAVDGSAVALEIDDVDEDLLPDVLVLLADGAGIYASAVLSILRNEEGQAFVEAGRFFLDGDPGRDLVLADLDRDGRRDPVIAMTAPSTIAVHRSSEAGLFRPPESLVAGAMRATRVAAGDLDGDGLPDLVTIGEVEHAAYVQRSRSR